MGEGLSHSAGPEEGFRLVQISSSLLDWAIGKENFKLGLVVCM